MKYINSKDLAHLASSLSFQPMPWDKVSDAERAVWLALRERVCTESHLLAHRDLSEILFSMSKVGVDDNDYLIAMTVLTHFTPNNIRSVSNPVQLKRILHIFNTYGVHNLSAEQTQLRIAVLLTLLTVMAEEGQLKSADYFQCLSFLEGVGASPKSQEFKQFLEWRSHFKEASPPRRSTPIIIVRPDSQPSFGPETKTEDIASLFRLFGVVEVLKVVETDDGISSLSLSYTKPQEASLAVKSVNEVAEQGLPLMVKDVKVECRHAGRAEAQKLLSRKVDDDKTPTDAPPRVQPSLYVELRPENDEKNPLKQSVFVDIVEIAHRFGVVKMSVEEFRGEVNDRTTLAVIVQFSTTNEATKAVLGARSGHFVKDHAVAAEFSTSDKFQELLKVSWKSHSAKKPEEPSHQSPAITRSAKPTGPSNASPTAHRAAVRSNTKPTNTLKLWLRAGSAPPTEADIYALFEDSVPQSVHVSARQDGGALVLCVFASIEEAQEIAQRLSVALSVGTVYIGEHSIVNRVDFGFAPVQKRVLRKALTF